MTWNSCSVHFSITCCYVLIKSTGSWEIFLPRDRISDMRQQFGFGVSGCFAFDGYRCATSTFTWIILRVRTTATSDVRLMYFVYVVWHTALQLVSYLTPCINCLRCRHPLSLSPFLELIFLREIFRDWIKGMTHLQVHSMFPRHLCEQS